MFDSAHFGSRFILAALAGAFIGFPVSGMAGVIATGLAAYFVLSFFGALERRDISDARPRPRTRNRPRRR